MTRLARVWLLAVALVFAAGMGYLTATAVGITDQQAVTTTTINVATGQTGPAGPPGPSGLACPNGFSEGDLVINHPGGQVTIFTCLKD